MDLSRNLEKNLETDFSENQSPVNYEKQYFRQFGGNKKMFSEHSWKELNSYKAITTSKPSKEGVIF